MYAARGNRIQNMSKEMRVRAKEAAFKTQWMAADMADDVVQNQSRAELMNPVNPNKGLGQSYPGGRVRTGAMMNAWMTHGVIVDFGLNRTSIKIGPTDEPYFQKQDEGFDGGWRGDIWIPGMEVSVHILRYVQRKFRYEFNKTKK